MNLEILPLAITMMAGPQIMSAIIFVTTERPVRVSLAFLAGVAIATTVGVTIAWGIASLLGGAVSFGAATEGRSLGSIIQFALIGLLILAALKQFLRRETSEPPKWLGNLMSAEPRQAFRIGLLVILVMPSDIVIMLTVGFNLEQHDSTVVAALPFIGLTVLVAAIPLLTLLVFHRRARTAMPAVRDWMNENSWLVNIIVYVIFIILLAG